MSPTSLVSAFAALAVISGTGFAGANAADLSSSHRAYNQNRDRAYTYDSGKNYDYDEGRTQDRRYDDRGRHQNWNHNRYIDRVDARASYVSDYMPYHVKEWRARSAAIDAWKYKVSSRYGERFAHWRMAEDKRVDCDAAAGAVYCTVSARPVRGWSYWSWHGSRDRDYR